jgi:hypothetical protein
MHHMAKAMDFHKTGMACLEEAAAACGAAIKAAGGNMADVAQPLVDAHKAFAAMEDHQELAVHHLSKVGDTWSINETTELPAEAGGCITSIDQATIREGDVPMMDPVRTYPGKAAPGYFTAGEVAARERAARLEGELLGKQALIDQMGRLPAGPPRARLFQVDKTALPIGDFGATGGGGGQSPAELLWQGISNVDKNNPRSIEAAGAKAIGNMLANPATFAKSVFDSSFRGGAGGGRTARFSN